MSQPNNPLQCSLFCPNASGQIHYASPFLYIFSNKEKICSDIAVVVGNCISPSNKYRPSTLAQCSRKSSETIGHTFLKGFYFCGPN